MFPVENDRREVTSIENNCFLSHEVNQLISSRNVFLNLSFARAPYIYMSFTLSSFIPDLKSDTIPESIEAQFPFELISVQMR